MQEALCNIEEKLEFARKIRETILKIHDFYGIWLSTIEQVDLKPYVSVALDNRVPKICHDAFDVPSEAAMRFMWHFYDVPIIDANNIHIYLDTRSGRLREDIRNEIKVKQENMHRP